MTLNEINGFLPGIKWDIKTFFQKFSRLFHFYLRAIELGDVENQYYGFYPGTSRFDMRTKYGAVLMVDDDSYPFDINDDDIASKLDGLYAKVYFLDGEEFKIQLFLPPFIFKNISEMVLESMMYKRVHDNGDLEYDMLHTLMDLDNIKAVEVTKYV